MSTQDTEGLLLRAVVQRDVEGVQRLLDEGSDPNAHEDSASTALISAAEAKNFEIVELLLEYGADPNGQQESGSMSTALHQAAQDGQEKLVRLLLEHWADPNIKDSTGSTPLHIAAKGKSALVVRLLIESGADLEARDSKERTPRFYPSQVDIARWLNGKEVSVSREAQETPIFPININGISLDPTTPAIELSTTDYVLIQSWARLSKSEWKELDKIGAQHPDYVSKNTYLCQYQDRNLDRLRKLEPVEFVDVYPMHVKIAQSFRTGPRKESYKVDLVFHEGVDSQTQALQQEIQERSQCRDMDIEFLAHKARLTVQASFLEALASIDQVRCIEEVGEVVAFNDIARQILNIDNRKHPSSTHGHATPYDGRGHVVAVADTGLDQGQNAPLHQAFDQSRILWLPLHGNTEDSTGHGTHVCASIVGDGMLSNGRRIMGTAPRAGLIVQSIWNTKKLPEAGLDLPSNLAQIFVAPYQAGVRIHSNSWGTPYCKQDAQGNTVRKQEPYNLRSAEIDKFVDDNPETVICFAAGNDGCEPISNPDIGHIGAEAAAKNCITVGASESSREARSSEDMASFSSHGPAQSGHARGSRAKPDVVAPGTSILSAASKAPSAIAHLAKQGTQLHQTDQSWCYRNGTSMATPFVAGCAVALRQALLDNPPNGTPIPTPTAALVKALLVNGAKILKYGAPNFVPSDHSGFGRVDMAATLSVVHKEPETGFREAQVSDSNPLWEEEIDIARQNTTLKATLVWTDPPGEMIKNSLQLVTGPSKRGSTRNNVQQIVWKDVPQGKLMLKVHVIGKTLFRSPQRFAIVWRVS
ncbi:hypothetical protein LTR84_005323 [Exophiala bonariae]|uniref:Peptidase S8/S53 domain-containing protein n=1 Tax=Exophiala bonariae TaxID=1690606 RepID=A0AAV9N3U2_9EURO|nr:hypothetical protein LTR84_005323 [Exophiala bonariae]